MKVVEKIKTHVLCSITFSRKSCRLFGNVEKMSWSRKGHRDNIIRHMRFACRITKATDTHSEYVILLALPRQPWLRERASVLRLYVHCLSCLKLNWIWKAELDCFNFILYSVNNLFTIFFSTACMKQNAVFRTICYCYCNLKFLPVRTKSGVPGWGKISLHRQ